MRFRQNKLVWLLAAGILLLACCLCLALALIVLGGGDGAPEPGAGDVPPPLPPNAEQMLSRDFTFSLPLFAPDSPWNQTATEAAVLPESDEQILVTYRVLRGDTTSLYPSMPPLTTWPFMDVTYDEYAFPIFRAGEGQQEVFLCDYEGDKQWPHPKFGLDKGGGPVVVPAPAGPVRPAGPQAAYADGHLVLYQVETFTSYDFWQATTVRDKPCRSRGGGLIGTAILEAGAVDFFDVRGPGANPEGYYSARATGTPLLAGLILPEDVESGQIAHALAFAIPGLRNTSPDPNEPLPSDYFYPASTAETGYYNTDPRALAAGQRLRLKESLVDAEGNPLDESRLAPITRMFLTALRTYGAYLVDNAGGFTFYAEDIHTAVLRLSDEEVNALIGQAADSPLPADKSRWQVVIEQLNIDLAQIPIAYGPWSEDQVCAERGECNPATAEVAAANFEVVEPVTVHK